MAALGRGGPIFGLGALVAGAFASTQIGGFGVRRKRERVNVISRMDVVKAARRAKVKAARKASRVTKRRAK